MTTISYFFPIILFFFSLTFVFCEHSPAVIHLRASGHFVCTIRKPHALRNMSFCSFTVHILFSCLLLAVCSCADAYCTPFRVPTVVVIAIKFNELGWWLYKRACIAMNKCVQHKIILNDDRTIFVNTGLRHCRSALSLWPICWLLCGK